MTLYDDVLTIAQFYLGPAAKRFMTRQITGHLNTTTENLAPQHLDELAKWCYVSSKLVIDETKAQEFSQKVKALGT